MLNTHKQTNISLRAKKDDHEDGGGRGEGGGKKWRK